MNFFSDCSLSSTNLLLLLIQARWEFTIRSTLHGVYSWLKVHSLFKSNRNTRREVILVMWHGRAKIITTSLAWGVSPTPNVSNVCIKSLEGKQIEIAVQYCTEFLSAHFKKPLKYCLTSLNNRTFLHKILNELKGRSCGFAFGSITRFSQSLQSSKGTLNWFKRKLIKNNNNKKD